jgi:predicted nucleic acid-binding protein
MNPVPVTVAALDLADWSSVNPMNFFDLTTSAARPTVYNSYYLVLAKILNCRLVTADQVFYQSLSTGPFSPYLLWVTDPI